MFVLYMRMRRSFLPPQLHEINQLVRLINKTGILNIKLNGELGRVDASVC